MRMTRKRLTQVNRRRTVHVHFRPIDGESLKFLVGIKVHKSVAVGEFRLRLNGYRGGVRGQLHNAPHGFPGTLGRCQLRNHRATAVHKVVRRAPVERPTRIGRERKGRVSEAFGVPTVGLPSANQVVEFLTVIRRDVLHVRGVLKPSFDLKTRDARVNERFQIAALIVVHQTQNVLTVGQLPSVAVKNGVGESARLGAGSAVCAAARFRAG